jgi:5'-3' exonuclease
MHILIIDLSSILYRIWHVSGDERNPNRVSDATVQACRQYAGEQPAGTKVAICCDSRTSKRKEMAPSYKANREPKPEALYFQLDRAKRLLANEGYATFESDGYEADDCIGTIVEWAKTLRETDTSCASDHASSVPAPTIRIVTSDKDLRQLVDDRVTVFSPATTEVFDVKGVRDKYGIKEPWVLRDWLALVGDQSDGIKGCSGCGEKTATAMLQSFGSLVNLYKALELSERPDAELSDATIEAIESIRPSVRKALLEDRSSIREAYKLIGLMPAPIDCARLLAPQEPKPTYNEAEIDEDTPPIGSPEKPAVIEPEVHVEQPKHVAMVRAPDDGWTKSLEPRSLEQAIVLAKRLFSSRLFGDVGNEDGALAKIMAGRSFGLDAMASLRGLNVIKGKVGMSAALMKGLCQSSPLCEYFRHVESNERYAVYVTKRAGDPEVRWRYTIEQARKAGLLEQDQWRKRPDVMLRWRCISELARDQYPDIVMGCYTPDEMAEIGD